MVPQQHHASWWRQYLQRKKYSKIVLDVLKILSDHPPILLVPQQHHPHSAKISKKNTTKYSTKYSVLDKCGKGRSKTTYFWNILQWFPDPSTPPSHYSDGFKRSKKVFLCITKNLKILVYYCILLQGCVIISVIPPFQNKTKPYFQRLSGIFCDHNTDWWWQDVAHCFEGTRSWLKVDTRDFVALTRSGFGGPNVEEFVIITCFLKIWGMYV